MVISQFFDSLKVGFLFSYVAPLLFVLAVTLFKEAVDDIYRFKQDKMTNEQEFTKLIIGVNNVIEKILIKSQDIQIGDIIEICQDERIPADMVILKTFDESGTVFIRTDQLDGETDWKLRKAPGLSQSLTTLESLFDLKGNIEYDAPSKMIYEFTGVLNVNNENGNYDSTSSKGKNKDNNSNENLGTFCPEFRKEALSLENTMWASTILASKKAIGIIIYTGKENRFQMNSSNPKTKKGALDEELNYLSKILFFIMLISALIVTLLKGFRNDPISMIFDFFRFVVLLCAIIPISLAVNLDISKSVNSSNINKDERIPETIARNSTIPEELGRIEYIFSDKTGTLTKNEMLFKKLAMENDIFGIDSFSDLKLIIEDECKKFDAPAMDILNFSKSDSNNIYVINSLNSIEDNCGLSAAGSSLSLDLIAGKGKLNMNNNKRIRRNRNKIVRDTIAAMALCNNVTPIFEEKEVEEKNKFHNNKDDNIYTNSKNNGIIITNPIQEKEEEELDLEDENEKSKLESNYISEVDNQEQLLDKVKNFKKFSYQASSPDEVALVKIAEELNLTLVHRTDKEMKVRNANDVIEEYDVLANFPFTSDTKRMGILLRNKKHGHILFYLKGAESIMEQFVKQEYKGYIRENAENLAVIGLRTLVLTQKIITEDFYQKWKLEYDEARTSLDDRKVKIMEVMSKLENNMDFLAVTGVEDLLQDDVCNTIESLRNAGIKVWMLTGDKVETATCISISAGLKNKADRLYYIKEHSKEKNYVLNELNKIEYSIAQTVLVIDGDCLEVALNDHEKRFFEISMKVCKKD
jgi:phospholipid-translocating ATPase